MKGRILIITTVLFLEFFIGSATGVQRTILSVYSSNFAQGFILALPVISFGIFKSVADVLGGFIINRLGRKPILIIGSFIYAIGVSLIIFLVDVIGLILGNLLIGFGEGLLYATAAVAITDILGSEEASRSFGYMEGTAYIGYGLGAIIGGFLWSNYGISTGFIYSLFASIVAIVLAVLFKETRVFLLKDKRYVYESKVPTTYVVRRCFSTISILATYIASHIAKVADTLIWIAIPLFLALRGFSALEIGVIQGALMFVWSLMMPFWGEISDKLGRKILATLGLFLNSLSILLYPFANAFPEALLLTTLMGIGYAMYYPILPAMSIDLAPVGGKAIAVGLYRALRDSGYVSGAILVGLLLNNLGFSGSFSLISLLLMTITGLTFILLRETRPFWPFFGMVVKHSSLMRDIVAIQKNVIESLFDGKTEEAQQFMKKIKKIEREADSIKRLAMGKMWTTFLPLGDRMDFERLIECIDRIAGAILECDERLLRVNLKNVNGELRELLINMDNELVSLANKFIENLEALRISPIYAFYLTDEVEHIESRIDRIRSRLMVKIRELIDEGKIDILSAIDLRDAVDLMEMVADDFEDASDIIRIIFYKHSGITIIQ